jgi:peptidoglycan hydrolase-like protein with peptidoglycan-binding domain
MTAATFAQLPMQFGGTLLSSASRLTLVLVARYMRAPLANTGIAALVGMSALAASNAMYLQPHAHPAPLFGVAGTTAVTPLTSSVEPVVPLTRPADLRFTSLPALPVAEKSVTASATEPGPVGNKDVFEVQRKLEVLRLFSGTIDGYYGPQTARAIKKFQELVGLKPSGELTPDLVERVRDAPMTLGDLDQAAPLAAAPAGEPQVELPPVVAPATISPLAPAARPLGVLPDIAARPEPDQAAVDPRSLAAVPLPTPEPLIADIETGSIQRASQPVEAVPTLLGRPVPTTADSALQMAADTAGEAIDTIMSGVEALTAPHPAQPRPAAYIPVGKVASIKAADPVAAASQPAVAAASPTMAAEPARVAAAPAVATDPVFVTKVQRGLASLGFLHGPTDGVAGEATAKAIRNFEVYFNYQVTGSITPGLLDLLVQNGASI